MTISEITGSSGGIILTNATYANPVTVTATAAVAGTGIGIYSATKWSILNFGSVAGTAGAGIKLESGGSVTNEGSGVLSGTDGVAVFGARGIVTNSGSIHASSNQGVYLGAGGSVTNLAGGTIQSQSGVGVVIDKPGTLDNSGAIQGLHGGVYLKAGGSVTNGAGAAIIATTTTLTDLAGLLSKSRATLNNSGVVSGYRGVDLAGGGTVSNAVSGTISGNAGGIVTEGGHTDSVFNAGTITASHLGVSMHAGTFINAGLVSGGAGVEYLGVVTNQAGGTITGGSNNYGLSLGARGNAYNAGTISGSDGVYLSGAGARLTNAASGTISGGTGVHVYSSQQVVLNFGGIYGSNGGIFLEARASSVTNASSGTIGGTHYGILAAYGGAILNGGKISGNDGIYVYTPPGPGASYRTNITNSAGADISGTNFGIEVKLDSATIENAGTIGGGTDAVQFTGAFNHRLIVDPGAVFDGNVVAAPKGQNSLELSGKHGPGVLSGVGDQFRGFQTLVFDAGANWTVAGSLNGTTAIRGFHVGDAIDLTKIAYSAGNTISLTPGNVLEILDSGSKLLWSAQLVAVPPAPKTFHIASDGSGGTTITVERTPPGSLPSAIASNRHRQASLFAEAVAAHGGAQGSLAEPMALHRTEYGNHTVITTSLNHH